ncbi:hypothetical protein TNCV_3929401 [Trichonephila clavipes]|nr:hypothetical protein TNCV_3929401 [Trichonephila clavipes]
MPRKWVFSGSKPRNVQQALAIDTLACFTHDYPTLPDDVVDAIYPIYEDLSNVKELERCFGGFTQNNNENYN